jgi:integrase
MRLKFTNVALIKIFSGPSSPKLVWDADCRPLAAYSNQNQSISLMAQWRIGRKVKKFTLGRLGELSITEARTRANELMLAGRNGKDLILEARVKSHGELTLAQAFTEYTAALQRKGVSPITLVQNEKNWRIYLAKHGPRELASFTKTEVRSLHSSWRSHGPVAANGAGRLLRTVFNYAIKRLTDAPLTNPCVGIEYFPQKNVRRTIEDPVAFMGQVARLDNPIRASFWKIAILTGLRKNDIMTMKWSDVHGDRIRVPHPKMGRPFDLPITEPLRRVLVDLRHHGEMMFPGNQWVFPASSKSGHIKSAFDKGLGKISPHCCRRFYATQAANVLNNPYLVSALLNHKVAGVTGTYVNPDFEQRREAAERVAVFIEGAISKKPVL